MIILSKCGYAESLQNSVNFWVITKEFSTIEDLLVNFAEDLLHIYHTENKDFSIEKFISWIINLCNGVCDGSYSSYYFEDDTRDYCFSIEDSLDLTKLLNLKTNDVIFINDYFEEIILSLILDKNNKLDKIEINHDEDNTRRVELKWLTKP